MLIKPTKAEAKRLLDLAKKAKAERANFSQILKELQACIEEKGDPEKEAEIRQRAKKQHAIAERVFEEGNKALDEIEQKYFEKTKSGGKDAIIADAKEQAATLLEMLHKTEVKEHSLANNTLLHEMGIGTKINGRLFLSTNYVMQMLREELHFHIEALQSDKQNLEELLEALIEIIETSELTDNSEIIDPLQTSEKIRRYRRSPLTEIVNYGLLNDKVNAQLIQEEGKIFQQEADGQLSLLWVVEQATQKSVDKGQSVPVHMALTYEGNDTRISKKLTAYDKQVYEAVATRFYYWQKDNPQKPLYISPQEIWRTMNGKASQDGKAKPSPAQVDRICNSIDKMRFTRFYMDIRAEVKAFDLLPEDERIIGGIIETYVLNASKAEFITDKGNTIRGYRIAEEPIIYTYNKIKNHILYVPYEMLDTSGYVSDGEHVAEIKGYLLQQIQLMKNAKKNKNKNNYFKRGNVILLDSIYKGTGILPPEERTTSDYANEATRQQVIRRTRKADRQKIEGLLNAFVGKAWIKGYVVINQKGEPIKEKQQAKGYSITL